MWWQKSTLCLDYRHSSDGTDSIYTFHLVHAVALLTPHPHPPPPLPLPLHFLFILLRFPSQYYRRSGGLETRISFLISNRFGLHHEFFTSTPVSPGARDLGRQFYRAYNRPTATLWQYQPTTINNEIACPPPPTVERKRHVKMSTNGNPNPCRNNPPI